MLVATSLYCQTRSAAAQCRVVECRVVRCSAGRQAATKAPRGVCQVAVVDDGGGSGGGPMSQVLPACVPQGSQRHSAKNATRARAGVGFALVPRHQNYYSQLLHFPHPTTRPPNEILAFSNVHAHILSPYTNTYPNHAHTPKWQRASAQVAKRRTAQSCAPEYLALSSRRAWNACTPNFSRQSSSPSQKATRWTLLKTVSRSHPLAHAHLLTCDQPTPQPRLPPPPTRTTCPKVRLFSLLPYHAPCPTPPQSPSMQHRTIVTSGICASTWAYVPMSLASPQTAISSLPLTHSLHIGRVRIKG